MSRGETHPLRSSWAAALVLAAALVTPFLARGGASSTAVILTAHTSCPTDYSGDTFPCSTSTSSSSTTVPPSKASLEAHYSGGRLYVKACGFTSEAKGHTAQLYVDGSPVGPADGGLAVIDSSGCATFTASVCLAKGRHTLAVVDQTPVPGGTTEVTGAVVVTAAEACRSAALASGSGAPSGTAGGGVEAAVLPVSGGYAPGGPASGSSGHHRALAFTGSFVARAVLVGVALILVGYVFTRRSRWHKRRRRLGYTRLR